MVNHLIEEEKIEKLIFTKVGHQPLTKVTSEISQDIIFSNESFSESEESESDLINIDDSYSINDDDMSEDRD